MECPNCKRVIVPGLKFCGGCGMSVNALLSGETGKPKNIEKPKASLSSLSSIFKKKNKDKKTIEELLEEQAGEKNTEATASDSQKTAPVAAPVDSPATNREIIEPDVDEEKPETQDATAEAPVAEEPAVEATAYTEPVAEEPVVEEPAFEVPVYEEPKYEAPVYTAPSYEEPKYEEPVETPAPVEEPVAETPAFEVPVYEEPKYEAPTEPVKSLFDTDVTPTYEAPVYTASSYEEPKYEEPVETSVPVEEPVAETPSYEAPVYTAPSYEEPKYEEPVETSAPVEEPVAETPSFEVPVYEEPKYEAPTEPVKSLFDTDVTPTYEAPVYTAPSYEEPKYEEPVETPAPVEEPVEETPSYEAPVYTAPSYEEPKYEEPVETSVPVEEPVAETPSYEAPVYTAPSYEEPKYEEPVETPAPVEEPVAETPSYEVPVYTAPSYEEPKYEEPVETPAPVEEPVAETPSYEAPVYTAPSYEEPKYEEPVEEKKEEPKSFFTADGNPIPAAPVTPPPIKKTEEEPKSEYSSFFDSLYSDDYQSVTPPNNTINKKPNNNGEKVYLCPKCNTKVIPGLQYCTGCAIALDKVTLVEESHVDKSFDVIRDGNGPSGYGSMPMYEPERSYVKDIKRKKSPLPTLLALAFILGVAAYLIFFVFRPFAPYKKALDSFFNGVSKMDLNEIVESVVPDEYFKSLNTNSTQMLDYFTKALQVASSTSNIKFVYRIKSEHKIASDDYNEYLQAIMNVTKKNIDKAYSLTLKVSASMNSGEKVNKQAKVMDFIAYQMDGKWYVLPSPTK